MGVLSSTISVVILNFSRFMVGCRMSCVEGERERRVHRVIVRAADGRMDDVAKVSRQNVQGRATDASILFF